MDNKINQIKLCNIVSVTSHCVITTLPSSKSLPPLHLELVTAYFNLIIVNLRRAFQNPYHVGGKWAGVFVRMGKGRTFHVLLENRYILLTAEFHVREVIYIYLQHSNILCSNYSIDAQSPLRIITFLQKCFLLNTYDTIHQHQHLFNFIYISFTIKINYNICNISLYYIGYAV